MYPRPCSLCLFQGFDDHYFPLTDKCGVSKLSSTKILLLLDYYKSCPTCPGSHGQDFHCKLTFRDDSSKVCSKGCKHNGYQLHKFAWKHCDQVPSVTVSNLSFDRSIPLDETLEIFSGPMSSWKLWMDKMVDIWTIPIQAKATSSNCTSAKGSMELWSGLE